VPEMDSALFEEVMREGGMLTDSGLVDRVLC
jgi:hypothetical protein